MNKKILAGMAAVMTISALFAGFMANAQTSTSTTSTASAPSVSQKFVLQIGPKGEALLRGTIASVASGVLTVNSWGGVWTVNVPSSAEVVPAAVGKDVTKFGVGDFVGVSGIASQSAAWTIDAKVVRDWTYKKEVSQETKQNIDNARQTIKNGTPRNFVGVASNISTSSLTLTENGTAYTVNTASNVEIVNRNWVKIQLSGINSGDTVRVWGVNTSGTISAQIIRDITLPVSTKTR